MSSAEAGKPPSIVVEGLQKTFVRPHERRHTLKERVLHPFARTGEDRFTALQDLSFTVAQGEFFGIVGRNGSGKSTLLKCLAGVYRADRGSVRMAGRLSTFIELGVGFNLDLPARDNVLINGVLLGLRPREALARYDDVIRFAELEDFQDLKLKNYSSGMQVRLAFSVMAQVDADILLIDEVLAVGDAAFQQKCFDTFGRLREEGRTILLVTHDMSSVTRFCDRALLLEQGRMRLLGEPERVAAHYLEVNFGRDHIGEDPAAAPAEEERLGSWQAEILDATFEQPEGEPTTRLKPGEPVRMSVRVRFNERVEHPTLALLVENETHVPLFATSSDWVAEETGVFEAGEEARFIVTVDCRFAPGRIFLTPWLIHRWGGDLIDRRPRMASAVVVGTHRSGAVVDLEHEVALERAGESRSAIAAYPVGT